MINSKRKGSKNERKVSSLYQTWTGFNFARTPASGGLRWKANQSIVGDIVCTDESHAHRFPFTIEAKSYREINFEHLISSNERVKILQFWDQAVGDAQRVDKIPILMVRYNQMERDLHYLFLPTKFFDLIKNEIGDQYGYLKYTGSVNFTILSSKDFFASDYNTVRIIAKKFKNG
jgi:Holliday junction resolvase